MLFSVTWSFHLLAGAGVNGRQMFSDSWSRRSFLKACLGSAFFLFGGRAFASGRRIADLSRGTLSLYNIHTQEKLAIEYRDADGKYFNQALDSINHFLRCHYTNKVKEIDLNMIEFVNAVDKELGGCKEIHVVSGFRSPEYNELLAKEGRGVARHSLHLEGKAIDLRIPGISLAKVHLTALRLAWGGVGYYPKPDFVHIDSGRFRFW